MSFASATAIVRDRIDELANPLLTWYRVSSWFYFSMVGRSNRGAGLARAQDFQSRDYDPREPMKSIFALAAVMLMTIPTVASAEQSTMRNTPFIQLAAASCQSFFSQCRARCANNPKGESQAKCTSDHCAPKLASCRSSGCWTEGAAYGDRKSVV